MTLAPVLVVLNVNFFDFWKSAVLGLKSEGLDFWVS